MAHETKLVLNWRQTHIEGGMGMLTEFHLMGHPIDPELGFKLLVMLKDGELIDNHGYHTLICDLKQDD